MIWNAQRKEKGFYIKFILRRIFNQNGDIVKFTASFVVGCTEKINFGYKSSFLVVDFTVIKLYLYVVLQIKYKIIQFDVVKAVPNGKPD